ncbi:hypothetical protein Fleli_0227 [Bernardetia litoralis DSM 6794]|uniref:Nucleotide-diphospho-sugar transferase n=1 Tax=Bernardetia litoralis (strain ATCC 23117 / DSM 6794 / NBRC 15988 / NCIMB 1366 / Fx l1 / Sio-4) TaxID=880071 RepID=I4AFI7_BERLS|nr:hypothetical protein [Bernardetia litoralis]AFM02722.1 hypothetical protein Fleli_0227 [Bernardetia litoralis DSM 6794]
MAFNTPILFLVFNRLDTTKQVFEKIKEAQPRYLYIAADGTRQNKEGEAQKCQLVRDYVINNINWECEVKTLFRDENLGCARAVSSAIDWFFENVEEGIILEDDILFSPYFLKFCEELLEKYRFDNKVMHIGGLDIQNSRWGNTSYYFSNSVVSIWGWATWKRAWKSFEFNIESLIGDKISQKQFETIIPLEAVRKKYTHSFESMFSNQVNSWAYRWYHAVWSNEGFCIVPNYNMIINIGFGEEGTHTTGEKPDYLKNTFENPFIQKNQLVHPTKIKRNLKADIDRLSFRLPKIEPTPSVFRRVLNKLKRIVK